MGLTAKELRLKFPNASESFIKENSEDSRPLPGPEPERIVRDEPLGPKPGKAQGADRVHVRVTSFRKRLCDPDNLCPKYFIDCLRYARLIRDDRQDCITLEVGQVKVEGDEPERTEIELS